MTAPADDDVLVAGYLDRLARATAALPADRREDLLASIGEHLEDARRRDPSDPLAVRRALDRLGPPEEVAASAGAPAPGPPPRPAWELGAVLLLTLGSLLAPLVGWLAGVVMLWLSRVWTPGEKVLGTLVVPGGLSLGVFGGVLSLGLVGSSVSCSGGETFDATTGALVEQVPLDCVSSGPPAWYGVLLAVGLLAALVMPVVVAVVLYRRAVRRVAAGAVPRR